jgi:hypothetical protein
MFSAMSSAQPRSPQLHRPTLLHVIATIERRIADLDRLGPPTARGHSCGTCKDAELHRLLGTLRQLASAQGG